MSISRTPSGTSWLLSVSVLLSLAALATALLLRHTHQAPTLPLVLLVAFGSAPAAVTFSRIQAPVVGGGPAVVVGLIAMTYGTWKAWKTDALHLLSMDFPMTQVATNAAVVMAPLALAALGVVLLLAGVARFSGDRLIASLATAGAPLLPCSMPLPCSPFRSRACLTSVAPSSGGSSWPQPLPPAPRSCCRPPQ